MKTTLLAQSNALTNALYSFDVYQVRFLFLVIREVRRLYIDSNKGNRTLFQNMYLTVKPEELKECGNPSLVFRSAVKLREKTIHINRNDQIVAVGWINYVKRDKKTGLYEIEVSKEILPDIVELAENFTVYELTVAITLKSSYSQRLYMLCSEYRNHQDGYFYRTVKQLNEMLELPKSYEDFGQLKRYVLDTAKKEIKSIYDEGLCDLYFDYGVKSKKGKKVEELSFHVITKERENANNTFGPDEAIFFVRTNLTPVFRMDKKFVDRIVHAIQKNPDISYNLTTKLNAIITKYPAKDLPRILRYVLNEDFEIK